MAENLTNGISNPTSEVNKDENFGIEYNEQPTIDEQKDENTSIVEVEAEPDTEAPETSPEEQLIIIANKKVNYYKQLCDRGLITQEQYEIKKKSTLGE